MIGDCVGECPSAVGREHSSCGLVDTKGRRKEREEREQKNGYRRIYSRRKRREAKEKVKRIQRKGEQAESGLIPSPEGSTADKGWE